METYQAIITPDAEAGLVGLRDYIADSCSATWDRNAII